MKNEVILIGGGGHCKAVIDAIECEGKYTISGILDAFKPVGESVLGYPVVGSDSEIEARAAEGCAFLVTVGQVGVSPVREQIFARLRACGATLATVVSPLAYVSPHATVSMGSVVMHYAVVNAAAQVGENCIINSRALVEHDAKVEAHCHIATGAILNGGVHVGAGSFVGSGAVVVQGVNVPAASFIKAATLYRGER